MEQSSEERISTRPSSGSGGRASGFHRACRGELLVPGTRIHLACVAAVDLIDHRLGQVQAAEAGLEFGRVHLLGGIEKPTVFHPRYESLRGGRLGADGYYFDVRSVEDPVLVADQELPNLLATARGLIF